jgi:hypothetical protein
MHTDMCHAKALCIPLHSCAMFCLPAHPVVSAASSLGSITTTAWLHCCWLSHRPPPPSCAHHLIGVLSFKLSGPIKGAGMGLVWRCWEPAAAGTCFAGCV